MPTRTALSSIKSSRPRASSLAALNAAINANPELHRARALAEKTVEESREQEIKVSRTDRDDGYRQARWQSDGVPSKRWPYPHKVRNGQESRPGAFGRSRPGVGCRSNNQASPASCRIRRLNRYLPSSDRCSRDSREGNRVFHLYHVLVDRHLVNFNFVEGGAIASHNDIKMVECVFEVTVSDCVKYGFRSVPSGGIAICCKPVSTSASLRFGLVTRVRQRRTSTSRPTWQ